jgi:hypothetical protein
MNGKGKKHTNQMKKVAFICMSERRAKINGNIIKERHIKRVIK